MRKLANFALFQIGWFVCVLESVGGHTATAVTLFILAGHLWFLSDRRAREAVLIAAVVVLGSLVTAFNVAVGAVAFPGATIAWLGVPTFILLLWALFATLFCHSLSWLRGRPLLAALLSLVGSPLSYRGAEAIGSVDVNDDFLRGPLVLGVTWAVAVPALLALTDALDRDAPDSVRVAAE